MLFRSLPMCQVPKATANTSCNSRLTKHVSLSDNEEESAVGVTKKGKMKASAKEKDVKGKIQKSWI